MLTVGGGQAWRRTSPPGLALAKGRQAIAGTASCEAFHFECHIGGTLTTSTGRRHPVHRRPGDVTALPSGRDVRVAGEESAITVD
jgi:hypothetical protein